MWYNVSETSAVDHFSKLMLVCETPYLIKLVVNHWGVKLVIELVPNLY